MNLRVGNGASIVPLAIETISVSLSFEHVLILYGYLHIPNVIQNVVSIPQLVSHNYIFSFACSECLIIFDNVCVGKAVMINNLYLLKTHACEYNQ